MKPTKEGFYWYLGAGGPTTVEEFEDTLSKNKTLGLGFVHLGNSRIFHVLQDSKDSDWGLEIKYEGAKC